MKSVRLLIGSLCLLGLPQIGLANCNGDTQADMSLCSESHYRAADQELNRLWKQLTWSLRAYNDRYISLAKLKESQRMWLKVRDIDCTMLAYGGGGGSASSMFMADCLTEKTLARNKEFERLLQQY